MTVSPGGDYLDDVDNLDGFGGDLVDRYLAGGSTMHWISLCGLLSLTVIVYKIVVFRRLRLNLNDFIAGVRAALLRNDVPAALDVCELHAGPTSAVVKIGLLKHGRPRDEIERSMTNAALHEVAYLEKYLAVLATVATVAPLLGFFGTVVGMTIAFDAIAAQGLSNPGAVARGVSVALVTTAWGLIVAFVTQPFYNWFLSKVAAHVRELETVSHILFETFSEMEEARAAAPRGR